MIIITKKKLNVKGCAYIILVCTQKTSLVYNLFDFMKISKEYSLLLIIGLFILAYLLDAVVQPLDLVLKTPYQFLQGTFISTFPFSAASVLIKALGLFLAPLWILSFFSDRGWWKASLLFIVAAIMQLYALQDVSTQSYLIPLEWSLSLSLAGAAS